MPYCSQLFLNAVYMVGRLCARCTVHSCVRRGVSCFILFYIVLYCFLLSTHLDADGDGSVGVRDFLQFALRLKLRHAAKRHAEVRAEADGIMTAYI